MQNFIKTIFVLVLLVGIASTAYVFIKPMTVESPAADTELGIGTGNMAGLSTTTAATDPACDGSKNQYFDIGFGITHQYDAEITPGQKVHMVLSCDHTRLTLSGAVNQEISSKELAKDQANTTFNSETGKPVTFDESTELADLSAGTNVVTIKNDFNFDGFNDLQLVASNGQGSMAIDGYYIFLYSSSTKQFKYSPELSAINNISISEDLPKTIEQAFSYGFNTGGNRVHYKWTPAGVLYKSDEVICESNTNLPDYKGDPYADPKYFIQKKITYTKTGKATVVSNKRLTIDQALGDPSGKLCW